jgi:hypothetical protein
VIRKREWVLLVCLLAAYNINLRQVSSYDTYASRFVPISILRDADVMLDEFVPDEMKRRAGEKNFLSDNFVYVRGHFYDSHPPIGPLVALPVYAVPAWIGIPRRPELVANMFSKLAASLMVALSAVLLFQASRRLLIAMQSGHDAKTDGASPQRVDRVALISAITYGLATSVWSTASLAMWTHTPAVLGFAAALWALTCGRAGLAGIAAAGAWFARPATAPAAALLGLYLLHRLVRHQWTSSAGQTRRADVLWFAAGAGVTALAGILYNYWLFGNFVGGAPFRTEIWFRELGTRDMFSGSLPVGFAGLTVSPSRGLFIFSPVVCVAIYGAIRAWRSPVPRETQPRDFARGDAILLLRYASLAALAVLLVYSKFIAWWGGHGFGPRYLTDAMPFVGLLFVPGWASIIGRAGRASLIKGAAIAALSYSIFIQAVGAFCWPESWTLDNNPPYRFRLWEWHDSQIVSALKDGPRVDPAAARLLQRLGITSAIRPDRATE